MRDVIIVKPEKCVGCNVCIRSCPAAEANVSKILENGKKVINVDAVKCIGCGECIKACPHGARDYVDDTEQVMSKLANEKIIILADPSIKAVYPNQWKSILDWFKKKGCLIYDASFGTDIAVWALLSAIESKKMGNIISQPCSAVLNYAKIYQPLLMKNIAPIYSPALCMAVYIKNYLRRNNSIAMLSPCIAKKFEYIDTGIIDFSMTFKKVMNYFEKNDIVIPSSTYTDYYYDFEDKQGQLGSLCSYPGGLKENILYRNADVSVTSSSGSLKLYPELELYAKMPESKLPEVFDVLSCEYGCNLGPGAGIDLNSFDVIFNMRAIENDIKNRIPKSKGMFRSNDDKLFKKFDDELELDDFLRSYRSTKASPVPTLNEIEPIFESMGKHTEAERNHNCGACGFNSCYEMAIAIFRDLNVKENCVVYAMNNSGTSGSDISEKVTADIETITENMSKIAEANAKNSEKTKVVNDLLKNIVTFCGKNSTMDSNSISQMIKILETTINSLSVFDENAEAVNKSVEKINELIDSLKAVNK